MYKCSTDRELILSLPDEIDFSALLHCLHLKAFRGRYYKQSSSNKSKTPFCLIPFARKDNSVKRTLVTHRIKNHLGQHIRNYIRIINAKAKLNRIESGETRKKTTDKLRPSKYGFQLSFTYTLCESISRDTHLKILYP